MDQVIPIAGIVGVLLGLGVFFTRQARANAGMRDKIRKELSQSQRIVLPELVTRLGMKDGFMTRGKVMNVMNSLVASGEVVQQEPPGTTVSNRLSVLTFSLKAKS